MNAIEAHPFAAMVPEATPDEYAALKADIQAHGLNERITLYEGMILDGRHRYRACIEGIEPESVGFHNSRADARAFVISANLTRRHLAASVRWWRRG